MVSIVPPIKCQGIKTKLVSTIKSVVPQKITGRWVEPFCGSCVVPFNVRPDKALLTDTNKHIIKLYQEIQAGELSAGLVKEYLQESGEALRRRGEEFYYEIRDLFNKDGGSLHFLFLNRACFNGIMRFNRKGGFNVPFCRKPHRFSKAYITKIVNQVKTSSSLIRSHDWEFRVSCFRDTLTQVTSEDVVYCDPPYAGRHVDYFNTWSEADEAKLALLLKALPCDFILSTWYKNKYRTNPLIESQWDSSEFTINTKEHFYHVGSTESLRHAMLEAVITNYKVTLIEKKKREVISLFD